MIGLSSCKSITSCLSPQDTKLGRSAEYQKEIDAVLAEDAEIKRWERIYLKEIAIAQDNNDQDAYKFFIVEFIKLPRLKLPEWMKKEPGHAQPVSEIQVLRNSFKILQLRSD